jgi:biotin operon repressor
MSTRQMAAVWPLQMPSSPKAVLVSLADNANDAGYCFPSLPTICERTCLGRTAVIEAIKWLEQHGALVADRSNGRHTTYTLTVEAFTNQSAKRTGPPNEPVRQTDGTSPANGRDQSARRTLTVKEPSTNRQVRDTRASADDVPADLWADWLQVRRAKRAGLVTLTALTGMRREADKAGIPLADAVRICVERGWIGFNAAWDWRPGGPAVRASAADRRDAETAEFLGALTGGLAGKKRPDPTTIEAEDAQLRRIA